MDTLRAPLRILMVCARYLPFTGGTETHVHEVATRLAAQGVDVTVLTTNPAQALPREERAAGVQVIRVPAYPASTDYFFAPGLAPVIRGGGWDLVHIQGYHNFVAPLAMGAAGAAGIPYVVTFHSGGHSSGLRNALRGLQARLLRPLLARAHRMIAVSAFEAELFAERLQLPAERFAVIPNGAHLPAVGADVAPDPNLIVSVGRLERYKGHHRAIEAMPALLERRPGARLRIVGVGPYEAELRALSQRLGLGERVEIGPVPPGDRAGMARLLGRAGLVTLLSDYESQGIAVLEALTLGRPVLVADTSALREYADCGLARAIPAHSSPAVTAAAMLDQLTAPLLPRVRRLPSWDACAERLRCLYQQIAAHGHGADAAPPERHLQEA